MTCGSGRRLSRSPIWSARSTTIAGGSAWSCWSGTGTGRPSGAGGRRLLELEERPGAKRDPDAADLFHFALRLPSRAGARPAARAADRATEPPDRRLRSCRERGAVPARSRRPWHRDLPRPAARDLVPERARAHGHHRARSRRPAAGRRPRAQASRTASTPGTVIGHVHLETLRSAALQGLLCRPAGACRDRRAAAAPSSCRSAATTTTSPPIPGAARPGRRRRTAGAHRHALVRDPAAGSLEPRCAGEGSGPTPSRRRTLVVTDPNGLAIRFVARA